MSKGEVAGKAPKMEKLVEGKTYCWCACGKAKNQPWCDGSHASTSMNTKIFKPEKDVTAAICMCKQTNNPPYCDGSHSNLSA
ncbi:MAG: CDGSH iron-sulfur domain-containing protein [Flavobacteriales bacterium]|nr:CDGSH iron-sulfur domain-containing protein [Flavobacteriales bacterium]